MAARAQASRRLAAGRIRPVHVGVVSLAWALCFAVLRLVSVAGGVGVFVVAGDRWTDPALVPGDVPVDPGDGFDGQFLYRLALDPSSLGLDQELGITFDTAYRPGRIAYPVLAWVVSFGGSPALAPAAMLVVNLVAIGVLGWAAGTLALQRGRSAAWGFLIASYWGFAIVVARDLGELVAAAAVFTALVFVGRGRALAAGIVLVIAVLAREQATLAVAAIAVGVAVPHLRQPRSWGAAVRAGASVAIIPAVAFVTWQLVAAQQVGRLPALASSDNNSTFPFRALVPAIGDWMRDFGTGLGPSLPLLCFFALVGLVALASTSDGLATAWRERPWEPLIGASSLLVLVSSSAFVLDAPGDFRHVSGIAGASWLVLLSSRTDRVWWAVAVTAPVTALAWTFRAVVL